MPALCKVTTNNMYLKYLPEINSFWFVYCINDQ